jgi:hypothetical protein
LSYEIYIKYVVVQVCDVVLISLIT